MIGANAPAIAETSYHRALFMNATGEPAQEIDMRVYAVDLVAALHDIRGLQTTRADLYDPDSYTASQAFARLLRVRQPRLWSYYLSLRKKQKAFELLDVVRMAPVLHVSSRYPANRGCIAMVVPLAAHATQSNAVIVFDLDTDPTELIELEAEAIAERVFVSRDALPEGVTRIPLKLVHANKSPALAPLTTLAGVDTSRLGLDVQRCLANLEKLRSAHGLAEKLRRVFATPSREGDTDPELALYDGFLPDADKRLLREVRSAPPIELASRTFPFRDPRYAELLFRYRARNWPETLNTDELNRWEEFRRRRIDSATNLTAITRENYFATIAALRLDPASAGKQALLDALEAWGHRAE